MVYLERVENKNILTSFSPSDLKTWLTQNEDSGIIYCTCPQAFPNLTLNQEKKHEGGRHEGLNK